ncbi:MAG TPA: PAS domain S-box protein [Thermoanaerobaculia bacterium]|nr:PAS domain S-box protein [Thermoanaerobaculia bacterium]
MAPDFTAPFGPVRGVGAPGEALRILVVDESAEDREKTLAALREGLPGATSTGVRDAGDLAASLSSGAFDVVVTDHRPAGIDAFHLLGRVREIRPDAPVLLCTGSGSEELAVAAMKAGFDDYVLKQPHHFPRLTSAVRSALDEAARRRVGREAETRYRNLFEGVPVGLYRSTPTGQVLDANPAFVRMLGYPSRESLMATNLCSLYVEHRAHEEMRRQLDTGGEVRDLEVCWRRYAGQLIWVRENIRAVRDPRGRLLHYEGLVEDITERRRAREELEESNRFRDEIISGAGEGIVVYDRTLRRIVWNRYMEDLTGVPADQALGGEAFDLSPEAKGPGEELLRRALTGETVSSGDLFITVPSTGRSGWVVGTYGPHRNAAGEIVGVIGIVRSVTERRRNEQALRESEERFRNMADVAPVMIWLDDAAGMSTYFSKPWLDFTGRTLEQELGKGSRDGIHPDDLGPRFVAIYEAAFAARRPFQTEYRLRRADGEYRWILETAMPRFTPSGEFGGFIGSAIDITERRATEQTLRKERAFLRQVIDINPNFVFAKDREGRFTLVNQAVADAYGTTVEGLIGKGDADFNANPDEVESFRRADRAVMDTLREMVIPEEKITDATGTVRWLQTVKRPVVGEDGRAHQVLGVSADLTERLRAERALRESEARFRLMADAAPVLIWVSDAAARCTFFNKPWLDFTGRTLAQEIGQGWMESVHADDLALVRRFDELEGLRESYQYEYRLRRHDGEYRWILDTGVPRFTPAGEFEGYIGSVIDITDRRLAEEALKESEARYRTQVENAPEAIVVFDVDLGRFVEANDNALRLWGLSHEELLRTDPVALSPAVQPDGSSSPVAIAANIDRALHGEAPVLEWIHRDAAGRDFPCEVRLVRLPSVNRRLIRGSVTDISSRKRAERLQSALYRIAATTSATEDINEFYAAIHGIVGELMYAQNFYVAIHDARSDTISFPYCVDEVDPTPAPMRPGNGLTAWVLRNGQPLLTYDEDFRAMLDRGDVELIGSNSVAWLGVPLQRAGKTFGVLVVQSYDPRFRYDEADRDLLSFVSQHIAVALERKRAQQAIRESEERYRLLFERNLAGVYRMTLVGRILECNDALARLFGYASQDELLDRDMAVLYPDGRQRRAFFDALLKSRSLSNFEMRGERRDGGTAWTLQSAALLADEREGEVLVEGTVVDITERRRLEDQLRQAQKMEGIGQLAGGIAHDFNNLLTTVLGYSDMALSQLSPHDPIREDIAEIRKAGERASNLTRQLLAFSRKQVFEPRVVDLNGLLADSSRMLARLIGEHIRLETELEPGLGNIRADPGQIEQVVVNLVVNARDAMPGGGMLRLRTGNADVDAGSARRHFGIAPGRYVVMSVVDNGVGIDGETQKRIFEPFFTTKETPRGTGLGLATVYGIVSQSGGQIFVESAPGKGSTFAIYLPRVEEAAASAAVAAAPALRRGSETILLVEDEDAVRSLTRRCLETAGYTVHQAPNAEEALAVAARLEGRLDLLLTDVVMPGASGPELSRRLLERRPGTRVLYVSGYTDASMVSHVAIDAAASFLQKPFTPETLARKVREVLDAREPAPIGH